MLIDQKLPGYRCPLSIIGHAATRSGSVTGMRCVRDVEELLFERGIEVSRESIRTWCINFSDASAQNSGRWRAWANMTFQKQSVKPAGYGAAIHELPMLDHVDQQMISTARGNKLIE